jgi:ankyrin repeat protein
MGQTQISQRTMAGPQLCSQLSRYSGKIEAIYMLTFFVSQGNHEMTELLISTGADLSRRNNLDYSAFEIALSQQHGDFARFLGEESLAHAIKTADAIPIIRHVRAGANPNYSNGAGWTPLISACAFGHADMAEELLHLGADVNLAEHDGWTPLMFAVHNNHSNIARLLLERGAGAASRSGSGHSARSLAEMNGNEDILSLLGAADNTSSEAGGDESVF